MEWINFKDFVCSKEPISFVKLDFTEQEYPEHEVFLVVQTPDGNVHYVLFVCDEFRTTSKPFKTTFEGSGIYDYKTRVNLSNEIEELIMNGSDFTNFEILYKEKIVALLINLGLTQSTIDAYEDTIEKYIFEMMEHNC